MNEKTKKYGALALAALVAAVPTGIIVDANQPEPVIPEPVIKEVVKNVTVEVPVEVPVEVEKIVEVDNENLQLVLDHIYDNNGNVEYLTEDLDDDEVIEIVDRITFINDVKTMAVDYVKKEGIDELDKEIVGDVELDDRDIERFKVESDDDEVVIEDVDFEDNDAEVLVTVRFEQDDVKYGAVYNVEFKDYEVDDFELVEVYERD